MEKLSNLNKKEQEILKRDKCLAQCPNCLNLVLKTDNYCGACGNKLLFTVSLTTSIKT